MAPESTIDEPLWKTIQRDFVAIGRNVRAVLIPLDWKLTKRDSTLTNWDLWGPLVSEGE